MSCRVVSHNNCIGKYHIQKVIENVMIKHATISWYVRLVFASKLNVTVYRLNIILEENIPIQPDKIFLNGYGEYRQSEESLVFETVACTIKLCCTT